MKFLVTTSPGLEEENVRELFELTGKNASINAGRALEIDMDWPALYRVLCGSYLSSRVLMPIAEFHAWEKEVLYIEMKKIPWETMIANDETFVCDVHGRPDDCDYSAMQGLLKIKDGIVDRIREKTGSRPDVDKDNPTHQIEVFFWKGKTHISIDLSGEPLHRRNYRKAHGAAPLRESRAAGLVRLSGINENTACLYDPLCGVGTIAIEAAMKLRKIPPADRRYIPKKNFIERFHDHYLKTLTDMREQALKKCPVPIWASDIDRTSIEKARKAAVMAGVIDNIQFEVKDFAIQKYGAGTLISNPPYGERLEDQEEAMQILKALGRKIKFESEIDKMILLVAKGMENTAGFKPSKKVAWKAGPLDLTACAYELWKGSKHAAKPLN
jgi:23S rRNA (guanine2445-N2)-methyltransferase / 23S rRNA (guanine2069-N7)-methyltransferase